MQVQSLWRVLLVSGGSFGYLLGRSWGGLGISRGALGFLGALLKGFWTSWGTVGAIWAGVGRLVKILGHLLGRLEATHENQS